MPFTKGNKLWRNKKTFKHTDIAKEKIKIARSKQIITEAHKRAIGIGIKNSKYLDRILRGLEYGRGWNKGMTDEKSSCWKGDMVGYNGLHGWVEKKLGKPRVCEHCGTEQAKVYDWANKSHRYLRKLSDWIRLCRKCHKKYDTKHRKLRALDSRTRYIGRTPWRFSE